MTRDYDVVVVGGGAAGLSAALAAAGAGRSVLLLVKTALGDGSTRWAQGGLAAVLDRKDSVLAHMQDTLTAGAGLCDPGAVAELVRSAPAAVAALQAHGARFDRQGDALALGREGGHRRNRIVHAGGDASGAEVSRVLVAALRRSTVGVREHALVTDLLLDDRGTVGGVVLSGGAQVSAGAVVLATGGTGQVFSTTSNPPEATGDGLALALRAGATVTDLEFIQFHPTVLWRSGAGGQQPLVTEALRGAGAVLVGHDGRRFMPAVHPLADLAPRDVVAAAIHAQPGDHVYLDATGVGQERLEHEFPTVLAACRARGVDPVTEPIPVAPGAHYSCGGIRADLTGATDVPGLHAVGEVAATGVHGANRLASNSLTEALIAGTALGRRLGAAVPVRTRGGLHPAPPGRGVPADGRAAIAAAMSRNAGVLRDAAGLTSLLDELDGMRVPPEAAPAADPTTATLHQVATLIATAALIRTESRGCHRRSDHPATEQDWDGSLHFRLIDGTLSAGRTRWGRAA